MNTSDLDYCGEILLVASNKGRMQKLVDCCAEYAEMETVVQSIF